MKGTTRFLVVLGFLVLYLFSLGNSAFGYPLSENHKFHPIGLEKAKEFGNSNVLTANNQYSSLLYYSTTQLNDYDSDYDKNESFDLNKTGSVNLPVSSPFHKRSDVFLKAGKLKIFCLFHSFW